MKVNPKYSVIIPVYNRPEELEELLASLVAQTYKNFEVIIVEDGSTKTSEMVYERYARDLSIHYLIKMNSGPGPSRNLGFQNAKGDFFAVFDSDCILPPEYFDVVEKYLQSQSLDAWGGPDRGHKKFTALQQAMAFTMSSWLTTGGIRGGKNQSAKFQPRSFNMGISKAVFEKTRGFNFDRYAEDIELSIRIKKAGFKVGLIPDAFVYHKRRATLGEFYRQVKNFGRGRARVGKVHPEEVKVTHWFPVVFLAGVLSIPFMEWINPGLGMVMEIGLAVYLTGIFLDALLVTQSVQIASLSIISALVQFTGYALGFMDEILRK